MIDIRYHIRSDSLVVGKQPAIKDNQTFLTSLKPLDTV